MATNRPAAMMPTVSANGLREITEAVLEVMKRGERGALATLVRVSGSTPQRPGARMLLRGDGSTLGTIGGGAIEQDIREALERVKTSGNPEFVARNLGYDLGMCCGGKMEFFVEPIEPVPRLVLCGAGHVGRALAPIAQSIGFEVSVIDERAELLTPERFPQCRLELRDPTVWLSAHPLGGRDWLLIVTHDHRLDEELLELSLTQPAAYIGLVGSRKKTLSFLERIRERKGVLPLDRMYAPVGLDIGAVSPEELAVSIAAELVALRRNKPTSHLRERVPTLFETDEREPI